MTSKRPEYVQQKMCEEVTRMYDMVILPKKESLFFFSKVLNQALWDSLEFLRQKLHIKCWHCWQSFLRLSGGGDQISAEEGGRLGTRWLVGFSEPGRVGDEAVAE